jgi:hypothetical protein
MIVSDSYEQVLNTRSEWSKSRCWKKNTVFKCLTWVNLVTLPKDFTRHVSEIAASACSIFQPLKFLYKILSGKLENL